MDNLHAAMITKICKRYVNNLNTRNKTKSYQIKMFNFMQICIIIYITSALYYRYVV